VVVATDGLDAARPQPAWWRFFVTSRPRERTLAKELDEVVHAFATLRCEVVVLDRVSGRRLGEVHRKALEALDGRRSGDRDAAGSAASEGHAA
jgi:hypothetical protein